MSMEGEAKSLMNNEAFVAATKFVRDWNIAKALACKPRDDEGRRRYLEAARIVDSVVSHINAQIQAAKSGDTVDPSNFYEERARNRLLALLNR